MCFLFGNSTCALKPLLRGIACITEFSTEAKDTCVCVDQRCSENFIGAGALLGIFAYISKQRPIIHCIH